MFSRAALLFVPFVSVAAFVAGCSRSDASPASAATSNASAAPSNAPAVDASVAAAPRPPFNVLLITIDSLRADMPWAGYKRPIAPRLTELAGRSTVYTQAYSTSSFTSKSLVGFLSGRYPSELQRTGVFFTRYKDNPPFLCELLAKEQIPCMTGQAHAYLDKGYAGLDRGFAEWKLVPKITFDYNTDPHVTSQKLTPLAIELLSNEKLRGDGSRPFFAWFHYMDPHDKYQGHDESPHWGTRPRDLYDEEVFYTDLWIGKLLDFVAKEPWGARTAIIVSADHGEAFGEHGRIKHAHELYEELVHVPLMAFVPGQAAGRRIESTRSALDLTPTIADLLGAKPLEGLHGKSFAPELLGEPPAPSHDIVTDLPEDEFNQRRRTFRHEDAKLIARGKDQSFELFDLKNDPREEKDLFGKDKELTRDMMARYKEASRAIADVAPVGGIPVRKD
ncbi:sulfatase-like hydrolase/transferase [Pendulispora rubella]|uniref:Sulfatase-like hydrolase/transferase n=1 Tax=Pendulispora rubella TaxID=2741070 RepID=A0ABZ2L110_9BACT